MESRMLTTEALAALMDWPRLFGKLLQEEAGHECERSGMSRHVELRDVRKALNTAYGRLLTTLDQAESIRSASHDKENIAA